MKTANWLDESRDRSDGVDSVCTSPVMGPSKYNSEEPFYPRVAIADLNSGLDFQTAAGSIARIPMTRPVSPGGASNSSGFSPSHYYVTEREHSSSSHRSRGELLSAPQSPAVLPRSHFSRENLISRPRTAEGGRKKVSQRTKGLYIEGRGV